VDIRHLTSAQVANAHAAADYLLSLDARLDRELVIKLDTLRADLTAALEDRAHAGGQPVDELAARRQVRP
jgi:phage-related protein